MRQQECDKNIFKITLKNKSANVAVKIGIASNIAFIVISQSWLLYVPNANDWASPAITQIFSNTPRMMLTGLFVYAISQYIDVFMYHFIWDKTKILFKDSKKGLWLRNNGSTLFSQFINSILFTFIAFYGTYDISTLWSITFASYFIFIITSICDTPIVYLSRKIKPKDS